jgi:hypothetical protein
VPLTSRHPEHVQQGPPKLGILPHHHAASQHRNFIAVKTSNLAPLQAIVIKTWNNNVDTFHSDLNTLNITFH